MRRAILFAVACSCFVVAKESEGAFFSGDELWSKCQTQASTLFCAGYIAGAIDALSAVQEINKATVFCMDPNVQLRQATDTVKLWLRDHPDKRHLLGTTVVSEALKEKFPCKEGNGLSDAEQKCAGGFGPDADCRDADQTEGEWTSPGAGQNQQGSSPAASQNQQGCPPGAQQRLNQLTSSATAAALRMDFNAVAQINNEMRQLPPECLGPSGGAPGQSSAQCQMQWSDFDECQRRWRVDVAAERTPPYGCVRPTCIR